MSHGYNDDDCQIMIQTAKARSKSRLQELIDFAKVSGFQKLGIANCKSVQEYADRLTARLQVEGFEVYAVNCKESGLKGCDISEEIKGACCDPVYQARWLNEKQTDFNINVGLCLGHGLLFEKHSKAAVTTFLVKSFAHNHNIVDALAE